MVRDQICCFTGHRPEKLPWGREESDPRCQALKDQLAHAVEAHHQKGCNYFLCGMARGCDLYFAEAVLQLRLRCPDIALHAVIPCPNQALRWSKPDRERYERILSQCDCESLIQQHYDPGCMQRRNRFMVDHSAHLIAVYNGIPKGGTAGTILYAMRQGLSVTILDLEESH